MMKGQGRELRNGKADYGEGESLNFRTRLHVGTLFIPRLVEFCVALYVNVLSQ